MFFCEEHSQCWICCFYFPGNCFISRFKFHGLLDVYYVLFSNILITCKVIFGNHNQRARAAQDGLARATDQYVKDVRVSKSGDLYVSVAPET